MIRVFLQSDLTNYLLKSWPNQKELLNRNWRKISVVKLNKSNQKKKESWPNRGPMAAYDPPLSAMIIRRKNAPIQWVCYVIPSWSQRFWTKEIWTWAFWGKSKLGGKFMPCSMTNDCSTSGGKEKGWKTGILTNESHSFDKIINEYLFSYL